MKGQNEILIGAIIILILAAAIAIQFQTSTPTGYASPPLPTNLTARPGANVGEIIVTWDLSPGATFYGLFIEEAGNFNVIQFAGPPVIRTTPLPPGEASAIHRYAIKACNSDGCTPVESAWAYGDPKISANASGPYTGSIGIPITLNATGLYIIQARDVAGYPTYSWSLTNNTANCSLNNSAIKNPTVTCSSNGTANAIVTITTFYSNDTAVSAPATITIGDTTPPVLSNGQPTGILPAGATGTTSTTISLTTNENASCKYSNTPGTAYASIAYTFTSTGTTSHSSYASGLPNGTSYNLHVRCQDIAGNVNTSDYNISFSVASSVDTTPPVLSNGQPTGTLPSGTTSTTISLITNEDLITCKYSTTTGTAYASMPNTFTTTGTTYHSTLITGLQNGQSHSYYVRCKDTAGNVNTTDYPISFSVAGDGTPPVLSDGQPTGTLPIGTTQTGLSLRTSENALCKYSTTPNTAFASMTNTFATTGRMSHSTSVSGLQNGTSYTYYVRCHDIEENANTSDYPISFSVAVQSTDITAPSAVSNLSVLSCSSSSCSLSWTSSGDDGSTGTAKTYDLRYSTSTITESNWSSALQVSGESAPKVSGSTETFTVNGLTANTIYFFALKVADEVPNWSALSNVVSKTTGADITPPVLSNGAPTGTLPAVSGGRTVDISLITNENATCRYSNMPGTVYASMTNTFKNTGLTPHSTSFYDIQNGQTYNYYVRCKDIAGNANTSDYIISFSVASGSCTEVWTCTSWSSCVNGTQTRTCTDSANCGTTNNKPSITQACGSCTNGQTQECITTENCAGTQTCSASVWGACQDKPGDNCPAQTQCTTVADCSGTQKEKCDLTARKYYSRTVNCVLGTCTAGSWIDSGEYCTKCIHCGDGELNCSESCDSCPTETGCQDTEAPEKPNGLTVYEKTETSITIRWNPNEETDLKRYVIYYGTSSGNYTSQKIALAYEVELTITGLQKATDYYITIKALDLSENSSPYSNEVTALTNGTIEPNCTENEECNELCDNDPDCTTDECIENGTCNKNCTTDPDCKAPEDNTFYWGIGTAIVVIAGALAYVFYHSGV